MFRCRYLKQRPPLCPAFQLRPSACARPKQVYKGVELLQRQLSARVFSPSPCLNLISTSYLKTSGLTFYPRIIHEDQLFTSQLYLKAEKVGYIPQKFFLRRFRTDSTMTRQFTWRNMEGYLTVTDELLKAAPSYPENVRRLIRQFLCQMLDAAVWQAHTLPHANASGFSYSA